MNVILFDDPAIRLNLLPFTFTRPVAGIRTGILTVAEKWEKHFGSISFSTQEYLQKKFPATLTSDNYWVNGGVCPDPALVVQIRELKSGEGLVHGKMLIALRSPEHEIPEVVSGKMSAYEGPLTIIDQVWKIFHYNADQIAADFRVITSGRTSAGVTDKHTIVYHPENIFIEEGASIRAATLNAMDGPIYIGKNSVVEEGAIIKGPFALGEGSHVNMGAKIRGNVTIGPHSKVGGEVSASVIFGFSNKTHDGFLGCSVIGEWCNLGADTNTSNLKNNYEDVKVWNYGQQGFVNSGLMFCGLMMGDHTKCGINTMFNTGTVIGISANIFGSGFPRNFIPSFAWGGATGFSTYGLNKVFSTVAKVMERRGLTLNETDKTILTHVFELESRWRFWEDRNQK